MIIYTPPAQDISAAIRLTYKFTIQYIGVRGYSHRAGVSHIINGGGQVIVRLNLWNFSILSQVVNPVIGLKDCIENWHRIFNQLKERPRKKSYQVDEIVE